MAALRGHGRSRTVRVVLGYAETRYAVKPWSTPRPRRAAIMSALLGLVFPGTGAAGHQRASQPPVIALWACRSDVPGSDAAGGSVPALRCSFHFAANALNGARADAELFRDLQDRRAGCQALADGCFCQWHFESDPGYPESAT